MIRSANKLFNILVKKTILTLGIIQNGLMYSQNVAEGLDNAPLPNVFFRSDEGDLYKSNGKGFSKENRTEPVSVCVKVRVNGKLSRQTFKKNESWSYYLQ